MAEDIERLGAAQWCVVRFRELWPDGMTITPDIVKEALENDLDAFWLIHADPLFLEEVKKAAYRLMFYQRPFWAMKYAARTDQAANDAVRAIVCEDPHAAYFYARVIDKSARDDTRTAACKDATAAYWYARDVDKRKRPDTSAAAHMDDKYGQLYDQYVKEAVIP